MSVFGVLNRANHNNKQSIPWDHGHGLNPTTHIDSTYYTMVARIKKITRFDIDSQGGTLCLVELEDHPYPPGDPTSSEDPTRQNPVKLASLGLLNSPSGLSDYIAIDGLPGNGTQGTKFDGEHEIVLLDFAPGFKSDRDLIYVDTINPNNPEESILEIEDQGWCYIAPRSHVEANLVDPARVMSHPSFPQREGEGIYTYPYPPDVTRNFVYSPAVRVDGIMQRTLSSNILVSRPNLDEDTIISEIWLGGGDQLSTLAEMFRVFHMYYTTTPDPGEVLGWEPRDRTGDRYAIQIVDVNLGGVGSGNYEYREVREFVDRNRDAFLDRQLTVSFKLARRAVPSVPKITMTGR